MLSEQIPLPLRQRVAAELSLDLKVFKLSAQSAQARETTQLAKLRLVERYIDENGLAGTIDEPADFFRGSLTMLFKSYREPGEAGFGKMVFWVARTSGSLVGLAGSSYHMVGHRRGASEDASYSQAAEILPALDPELEELAAPDDVFGADDPAAAAERSVLRLVRRAIRRKQTGIPTRIEFLAVTQLRGTAEAEGNDPAEVVLLGSPIYVARGPAT